MIVYLITNNITGHQYVGQTIKSLETRWQQHNYDAARLNKYPIHKALLKYTLDTFSVVTLHKCETKEEMDFVETFYIHLLNTKGSHGYNILDMASIAGAHTGHKHSMESRAKMGIDRKGRPAWNKGLKMSPEFIEKNRKAHLGIPWPKDRKRNNGWLGRVPTQEHREKIRAAKKGKGQPWSQKRRELFNKKTDAQFSSLLNAVSVNQQEAQQ